MALSPENASTARSRFTSGKSRTYSAAEVNTLMDAARAQGRASLEERCKALEEGLRLAAQRFEVISSNIRNPPGRKGRGIHALATAKWAEQAALLATPGERENG